MPPTPSFALKSAVAGADGLDPLARGRHRRRPRLLPHPHYGRNSGRQQPGCDLIGGTAYRAARSAQCSVDAPAVGWYLMRNQLVPAFRSCLGSNAAAPGTSPS